MVEQCVPDSPDFYKHVFTGCPDFYKHVFPDSLDFYKNVFTDVSVCDCGRFMMNAHAGNRKDEFFKPEPEE